jgi:hypothetical protein
VFPWLILDGASGAGKTQQVFAMLKNGERLAYQLLVPEMENEQKIYAEMRSLNEVSDPVSFLSLVDDAFNDAKDRAQKQEVTNPFSMYFLKKKGRIAMEKGTSALRRFINYLADCTL